MRYRSLFDIVSQKLGKYYPRRRRLAIFPQLQGKIFGVVHAHLKLFPFSWGNIAPAIGVGNIAPSWGNIARRQAISATWAIFPQLP